MVDEMPLPAETSDVKPNIDLRTVQGFGDEWDAFDQTQFSAEKLREVFDQYFSPFPWADLPKNAEGFDMGCGSGRWAALVASRVGKLHCIDPAKKALEVAKRRLKDEPAATFHHCGVDDLPMPDGSQDFGYSLGVLHHIPDTLAALKSCTAKLKPGAPFLLYLYYDFENRPLWFRRLWQVSDHGRRIISRLPFTSRKVVTTAIAATVYWPFARGASLLERAGMDVSQLPLSAYRGQSFYVLQTDALDRFGTSLEQRFSRSQMDEMMRASGLVDIQFRDDVPYWVACGRKAG